MRSPGLFLAGLGAIALFASPASGHELPCGQTAHLARLLDQSYGEVPVSAGLQGNGQLLQIFASPTTGTWTAVTTTPRGLSCVIATGQRWADDMPEMDTAARTPPAAMTTPHGPR